MTFRLVRSGTGPIFRAASTIPDAVVDLLLRGPLLARIIGPEDEQSIRFADRLRELSLMGKLRAVWTHIPHEVGGGSKNAALRYSLAKALGLITGSADYVFVWADGGGWLEMKRAKAPKTLTRAARSAGALTKQQKGFAEWCALTGTRHRVIHSAEEGFAALREWGVLDSE